MIGGIGFKRQRLLIFYRTKVLYTEIYNHLTYILNSSLFNYRANIRFFLMPCYFYEEKYML